MTLNLAFDVSAKGAKSCVCFQDLTRGLARSDSLQIEAYKQVVISNVEHSKLLTILSPDERYTYFCETHRNLEQRIQQKQSQFQPRVN